MTDQKKKSKQYPIIKCTECDQPISKELKLKLAHNESVVCEYCGEKISNIPIAFKRIILENHETLAKPKNIKNGAKKGNKIGTKKKIR